MTDDVVGTVLAGYRLEELIGRGGMSTVYRAEHIHLGKKVALKVLSPILEMDEEFRERFLRESRVAASIEHPNVIPIYDAGDADGHLYIAERHVNGLDLKQLIERDGPLSLARSVYIIEQIAAALDAAHARGLVHRDVKPGNVLVEEGTERVFLTDFGVVKHSASTGTTRTGYFLGTIDYAAPEQIEGRPVDARTDVYAAGCLLYECLTGSPPFQRAGEMAAIHAHLTQDPPRASAERPELPPGVDDVIGKAMAKQQAERYASAGAFARALRAAALEVAADASQQTAERATSPPTIMSTPVVQDEARVSPAPAPQEKAVASTVGAATAETAPPTSTPVTPPPPAARTADAAAASEPGHGPRSHFRRGGDDPAEVAASAPAGRWPRRRTVLAVLALVLVAAGGAAAAVTALRGGHTSSGSSSSPFPDAIERDLVLAHIPPEIRSTCTRVNVIASDVFLRTVKCSQGGTNGTVTYSRAHSLASLRSYFLNDLKVDRLKFPTKSECSKTVPSTDEWSRQGQVVHIEGASPQAEGRVACTHTATRSTIYWTDTSTKMFVEASRPNAKWPALYRWWEETAGPEKELGMDMTSMGTSTTSFPDAIEQELLLDHIPNAIRGTCVRSTSYDQTVFLRAVQCNAQPKGAIVTYMYAHAGSAMTSYSNDQITAAGLNFPTTVTCASSGIAADTWVRTANDIGHIEKPGRERSANGRVLCYIAGGSAIIGWTDIDTGIYARATAPSGSRKALYRWWKTQAGPGALLMTMGASSVSTTSMESSSMPGTTTTTAGAGNTGMEMTSSSSK